MSLLDDLRREVSQAFDRAGVGHGERVLVACSGGPDSRVLLEVLVALRSSLELQLSVATVDHGLRVESAAEAQAVVAVAAAHGLPATVLELHLVGASMAKARQARYAALTSRARSDGIAVLAVAHTATDQAETLLHRLARGTGLKGLGAMAPSRWEAGVRLVRPLLGVSSATIEAVVAAEGWTVARDPTNHELGHVRARIRHQLLPLLRPEHPDLDRQLAALCARLRDDETALQSISQRLCADMAGDGWLRLAPWREALPALQTRALQHLCPASLSSAHLQALGQLCANRHGSQRMSLPSGWEAERSYDRLRFSRGERANAAPAEVVVSQAGLYSFAQRQIVLDTDTVFRLASDGQLVLRGPRPGDRLPGRSKKLGRHLIDRKVPEAERALLPILARRTMLVGSVSEEVVWVGAFPAPSGPEPVDASALTAPRPVQ